MKRRLELYQAVAIVVALQEITKAHEIEHERLVHGLSLMLDGNAYYSQTAGSWMCESKAKPGTFYAVDLQHELCTCPDRAHRGTYCKHIVGCWIMWRVSDILANAHTMRADPENVQWLEPVNA